MVTRSLWLSSLRHFLRHRWLTLLSIGGILLGVAVIVAVDIANESARRAFQLSMEGMTGEATHQILGSASGFSEEFYVQLRLEHGVRRSAPVVEGYVSLEGETLHLLGIDPLAEQGFRPVTNELDQPVVLELISQPATVLLAASNAQRHGLVAGERMVVEINGQPRELRIAGILETDPPALSDGLLVTDIATAQELLNLVGRLDRVDLVLTPEQAQQLRSRLPQGLRLVDAQQRTQTQVQMTEAFRVNLMAMSLLAVEVGGFLIFNTMTFSVIQRRRLLGNLRALGVSRQQLLALVLTESLLIGLVGSLLGLVAGTLIGRALVGLVTRTINDLYFIWTVKQFLITPAVLWKGLLIGLLVTLTAAAIPALEAARSRPLAVQRRSVIEHHSHRLAPWLAGAGVLMLVSGLILAQLPSRHIQIAFFALFLIVMGYSLLVPWLLLLIHRLFLAPLAGRSRLTVRLAVNALPTSLSRTGPAIAALAIAVSATVGVAIMIQSFRDTVALWLENTLRSDIYVSAPSRVSNRTDGTLDPRIPDIVRALPGVREISSGRSLSVETNHGQTTLLAVEMATQSHRGTRFKLPPVADVWQRFQQGELVLISEPYATRHRVSTGSAIDLFTDSGWQRFLVGGIFYDYSSDQGMLVLARAAYDRFWQDPAISTIGLFLEPGADQAAMLEQVHAALADIGQTLRIRSNRSIREHSLAVFDRTFVITRVLRWLAVGVAFIGILSALMALQLERAREYAVLRATGFTPGQITAQAMLHTGLMGLVAGLLALPLGLLMSHILVHVINLRSFGWSMAFSLPGAVLVEAIMLSLGAALLAGVYPAYRLSRTRPALALREE